MWVTAQELIQVSSMPNTVQGVSYKAKSENWERRKAQGIKGGAYEYNLYSLSILDQALVLKTFNKVAVGTRIIDRPLPVSKEKNYCSEALWANYEQVPDKTKQKAMFRVNVVLATKALIESGVDVVTAFETIAKSHECNPAKVRRWFYKVKGFDSSDYLPVLIDKYNTRDNSKREVEITPEAWEFFKADYLRLEKPSFNTSYYLTKEAAKVHGWKVPSVNTMHRRLDKEVPEIQQVLLREGEHAAYQRYPSQRRSVEHLEALEWINGDGYKHNVFVQWHTGEIIRPKTWLWQDVRTRKILAYRCDISENTDSIRLSLADLVNKYGIPKHMVLDNTTAAANKAMTGGVKTRKRYQHVEGEAMGIIPMLGIEIHWTSINFGKGHGQAKPIERAFSHGGLGELVDKHPTLAGFYTGPNVQEKPDNYDNTKGAPYDVFIAALEDGINRFNARPNRNTEVCQGVMSFNEAFEASYKVATVRKATKEQYRIMLLASESVTLQKDGTFELKAGKLNNRKNRYFNESLMASRENKIVARFDPQNLHSSVLVYTLDGRFLCEATCHVNTAFDSMTDSREHDRNKKQVHKHNKKAALSQKRMNILEVQALLPKADKPEPPDAGIIEIARPAQKLVNAAPQADEQEEAFDFDSAFSTGIANLLNQKENS